MHFHQHDYYTFAAPEVTCAPSASIVQHTRTERVSLPPPSLVTLSFDCLVTRIRSQYPALATNVANDVQSRWVIIQQHAYTTGPLHTPVHNPRMVVQMQRESEELTFQFEVHYGIALHTGTVTDGLFDELLQSLLPGSGYRVCPGLPDDVCTQLTFESKNARKWGFPFNRVDHKGCKIWYRPLAEYGRITREPTRERCTQLLTYLKVQLKKRAKLTSEQKAKCV